MGYKDPEKKRANDLAYREERINEIDKMFDVDPSNSMNPS